LTVLDGAHNPAAAVAVASYLRAFRVSHPDSRVILVLGMMRDKDHRGFFDPLKELVDEVVLTQADLPRSATVQQLQIALNDTWSRPFSKALLNDALGQARQLARQQDLICVTGSLMLIGDVKALLGGCGLSPLRG
jgi:dihydrofolate synthase/folylpolyglutamate synthase